MGVEVFVPHIALACFSYRGSYFKYRGEGSQILWIRCGGAVTQGVVGAVVWCMGEGSQIQEGGCHTGRRWSCRLVCVCVRVQRIALLECLVG